MSRSSWSTSKPVCARQQTFNVCATRIPGRLREYIKAEGEERDEVLYTYLISGDGFAGTEHQYYRACSG